MTRWILGRQAAIALLAGCGPGAKRTIAVADSTGTAVPRTAPLLGPGEAYLPVPDGRIWYRVVGTGTGTPVILLHGGPGFSSYYLKVFERLGDDRTVVRYDQLGGGKSAATLDTSKTTIAHFVAELDSLRSHLGFDRVHVLGHSWGTMLGFEYYRAHPDRVASLVLASPSLDIPAWERNAKRLVETLSDSSRKAVAEAARTGRFDSPGYQVADGEFRAKFVMRSPAAAVQADLDSTRSQVNRTIYNYMQGPSEFTVTGTFKHFDASPYFGKVRVPVLFTVGEFDESNPELVERQAAQVPRARFELLKGSAHITPWDAPDRSLALVREFLRSVDAGSR